MNISCEPQIMKVTSCTTVEYSRLVVLFVSSGFRPILGDNLLIDFVLCLDCTIHHVSQTLARLLHSLVHLLARV